MFLELTLSDNNAKILFSINRINCIFQIKGVTNIYIGEVVYQVRESYEEIVEILRAYLESQASLENETLAGHTFTDICNAIKALEQTMWIPVEDKLPERDVSVLTYHRNESFDYQYVSWIDEYSGKW